MTNTATTRRAIVLMGVSGCGKSTIGRLLAEKLDCPFVEGDELHDTGNIEKMRSGIALDDTDRWPWLDRVAVATRNALGKNETAVAACSALKAAYRQRLAEAIGAPTLFVLLDVGSAELERRLQLRTGHFMPAGLLSSQLEILEKPEVSASAIQVDARATPEDVCQSIHSLLA